MLMHKIETVGNLQMFWEDHAGSLFGDMFSIVAVNGGDIVARETFEGTPTPAAIDKAEERLLQNHFDIVMLVDILAGVPEVEFEYNGKLLYGKIAGFSNTEYFKRIDRTRFYQHYTHRPMMKEDAQ